MKEKILVIEDEKGIRENLKEILALKDYLVYTATNAKEGITEATVKKPDMIICETNVPEIDGFEVLQFVRQNRNLSNVPFIFLTAFTQRAHVIRRMELGADDYITKPFTTKELVRAIENCFRKQKQLQRKIKEKYNDI